MELLYGSELLVRAVRARPTVQAPARGAKWPCSEVFDAIRYLVSTTTGCRKEELLEALGPASTSTRPRPVTISRAASARARSEPRIDRDRCDADIVHRGSDRSADGPGRRRRSLRLDARRRHRVTAATMLATPSNDPFVGRAEPWNALAPCTVAQRSGVSVFSR